MKALTIFILALFLVATGANQSVTRKRLIADKRYELQAEYYASQIETFEEPETIEYAETLPSKRWGVPLSAELQDFVFENCGTLSPELIIAVMFCESEFIPTKINGKCYGLMQIKKSMHADRMAKYGVKDILEPKGNILIGIDYLTCCIGKYGLHKGLIAYNSGENNKKQMKYSSTDYSRKVVEYMEGLK